MTEKQNKTKDNSVIDGKNELFATTDILLSDFIIVGELGSGSQG